MVNKDHAGRLKLKYHDFKILEQLLVELHESDEGGLTPDEKRVMEKIQIILSKMDKDMEIKRQQGIWRGGGIPVQQREATA